MQGPGCPGITDLAPTLARKQHNIAESSLPQSLWLHTTPRESPGPEDSLSPHTVVGSQVLTESLVCAFHSVRHVLGFLGSPKLDSLLVCV